MWPSSSLDGPEVLGPLVNQGRLGPSHCVGSVRGWVEAYGFDPAFDDPAILPGGNMK